LCEADAVSQAYYDDASDTNGDGLYKRLQQKGLGSVVDNAIGACVPLYVGQEHVAMSVNIPSGLYTTLDMDKTSVRVGTAKEPYVFEQGPVRGQVRAAVALPGLTVPLVYRNPTYYEKVVLVGRDSMAPYFSEELTVLSIGVSYRNFCLSGLRKQPDLPLTGAVVIALSDAAVLGQFCRPEATSGLGLVNYCLPLRPELAVSQESPVALLKKMFPILNPSAWSEEVVEEVFTHSSRQVYQSGRTMNAGLAPLAIIGDNAAKVALYSRLRDLGVPYSLWQRQMQTYQSNSAFAELAWKFGYAKFMQTGGGVTFPTNSKAYADLTEALLAGVYLSEKGEVFEKFCELLGVIPSMQQDSPNLT